MTPHSHVDPSDLVTAVGTALAAISGAVVQPDDEITEGIADTRTIQVYLSEAEGALGSRTHVNTLGGGLKLRRYAVRIDVYSQPRSNLGENIAAAQVDLYAVMGILEAQPAATPFALSGVHTFHWSARMGVFPYAGSEYWGSQFTLEFMCH